MIGRRLFQSHVPRGEDGCGDLADALLLSSRTTSVFIDWRLCKKEFVDGMMAHKSAKGSRVPAAHTLEKAWVHLNTIDRKANQIVAAVLVPKNHLKGGASRCENDWPTVHLAL